MLKFGALIGLCASLCVVSGVNFTDCGSKAGKYINISVEGCDLTKPVCVLKRNTTATISIDFELVEAEAKEVNTVVHGVIMGIEMPFPLQNPNGCIDCGLACPLTKDSRYAYKATLAVLKSYPKVKVDVKWQLKNENKEDIVCLMIPAKIE